MPEKLPTILIICGPTASGKTSLAFDIAEKLPRCAIFSVDSRQAYIDLSILTGKDVPENLPENIRFFGTDRFSRYQTGNVAVFTGRMKEDIKDCLTHDIPVIIVGGSGLYLKALTSKLSDLGIPPNEKLRHRLSKLSLPVLQEELDTLSHQQFTQLNNSDRNNPRRLIRHIEKLKATKRKTKQSSISARFYWVGLSLTKEEQRRRIIRRIDDRLNSGVIAEVKNFLKVYPDSKKPIYSSLGLKEIAAYLKHSLNYDEMKQRWLNAELSYAKRQMVWFRKQPFIIWYDGTKVKSLAKHLAAQIWPK